MTDYWQYVADEYQKTRQQWHNICRVNHRVSCPSQISTPQHRGLTIRSFFSSSLSISLNFRALRILSRSEHFCLTFSGEGFTGSFSSSVRDLSCVGLSLRGEGTFFCKLSSFFGAATPTVCSLFTDFFNGENCGTCGTGVFFSGSTGDFTELSTFFFSDGEGSFWSEALPSEAWDARLCGLGAECWADDGPALGLTRFGTVEIRFLLWVSISAGLLDSPAPLVLFALSSLENLIEYCEGLYSDRFVTFTFKMCLWANQYKH